jgi:hypothetical protein
MTYWADNIKFIKDIQERIENKFGKRYGFHVKPE